MAINFEEEKARNMIQKMAYEICDKKCNIDPIKCASRYGNFNRCRMLAEELDKSFDENAVMHGE